MAGCDEGEPVRLFVYDLSRGLARQFSPMLLGKQIDGIWHSSIVVGGEEFYFGFGINVALPGLSPFGQPTQVIDLGVTFIPQDVRDEFLADLSERYTPQAYNLLHNNCNNFSNELANLLVGQSIPAHITGLPAEVLSTPFGQMMLPMLQGLEQQLGSVQQQPYTPHSHPQHPAAAAAKATPAASPATQQLNQVQPEQGTAEAGIAGPSSTSAERAVGAASNNTEAATGRDGPAVEAAAEQIAAATGLALMEEVELRDHQTQHEQEQEQELSDGARAPVTEAAAPAVAVAMAATDPPGAEAPTEAAVAEEVEQQQAAAGTPPSAESELSAPAAAAAARPPRSAAAAAAAAAAERRALAAAGQGSIQPGAEAGGMGSVDGSGTAVGAEEGKLKVECEEEVRAEFARLMAAGEMTAVEVAAAAAQRAASRGQFEGTAKAQA